MKKILISLVIISLMFMGCASKEENELFDGKDITFINVTYNFSREENNTEEITDDNEINKVTGYFGGYKKEENEVTEYNNCLLPFSVDFGGLVNMDCGACSIDENGNKKYEYGTIDGEPYYLPEEFQEYITELMKDYTE